MIWFIVLSVVMNNGEVYTQVHFPNSPEYNNEQTCNEAASAKADKLMSEIGTSNGKVYYVCENLSEDEFKKATQKPGQEI